MSPRLPILLPILLTIGLAFVPTAFAIPLASAVNNGNGGTFNLNGSETYTGTVTITANTTINANGATIEVVANQFNSVDSVQLNVNDAVFTRVGVQNTSIGFIINGTTTGAFRRCNFNGLTTGIFVQGDVTSAFEVTDSTFTDCGNGMQVSGAAEPNVLRNTFRANAVRGGDRGMLITDFAYPAGNGRIADNDFIGMGGQGIQIAADTGGMAGRPIIEGNEFALTAAPNALGIRTSSASPHIRNNTFTGGGTALEFTGANSYPGELATQRPVQGNTFNTQGIYSINMSASPAPDILNNNFNQTTWAISVSEAPNLVQIEGNVLQGPGLVANNNLNGASQGITVLNGTQANVVRNFIANHLYGIHFFVNCSGLIHQNDVTLNWDAGILIVQGSSATVTENNTYQNRQDNIYFGNGCFGDTIGNISRDSGRIAGVTSGATGIAYEGATGNVVRDNVIINNLDQGLAFIAGSEVGLVESNVIGNNAIASILISGGARAGTIRNNIMHNTPQNIALTGAGVTASGTRIEGNIMSTSAWGILAQNTNQPSMTIDRNLINFASSGAVGATQSTFFNLRNNAFLFIPGGSANIISTGNSPIFSENNHFDGPTPRGIGTQNSAGIAPTSQNDWWLSTGGPNSGGLSAEVVTVQGFATQPIAGIGLFAAGSNGVAGAQSSIFTNVGGDTFTEQQTFTVDYVPAYNSDPLWIGALRQRTLAPEPATTGLPAVTVPAYYQLWAGREAWWSGNLGRTAPVAPPPGSQRQIKLTLPNSLIPGGANINDAQLYKFNGSGWDAMTTTNNGSEVITPIVTNSDPSGLYVIGFNITPVDIPSSYLRLQ